MVSVSCLSGGHFDSVTSLSLSENNILASGGDDGYLCLWSIQQPSQPIIVKEIDQEACWDVLFSKEKSEYLYTAFGSQIYIWDTRQMIHPVNTWNVNSDEVNCLALLESGNRLASADDSGQVKIIDTVSGEVIRTLHKHDNICSSVIFRPNRSWQLISGGLDCRLIVSDWKGSGLGVMIFEMEEMIEQDTHSSTELTYSSNPPMIHTLAATPNGSYVVCGLENSTVEVFNSSGKNLVHVESLYGHSKGVSCLLCIGDSHLVSGGNDGSIFVWPLVPESLGGIQFTHGHQINSLAGRQMDKVIVADYSSVIKLMDLT